MDVGTVFNTVRLGNRGLAKGDTVTLVDGEDKPFGQAEVVDVIRGPWSRAAAFATDNHSVKDRPAGTASVSLREELVDFYGDKITDDTEFDVIYLRRDK